ncbi:MAG TPA: CDP-alcohol phosphatidyltransferase family protein [Anaerolineae bacterium]|nr:CDP-alcohol phosphatidyltransferase family protein [Anaerolineae bacterium]
MKLLADTLTALRIVLAVIIGWIALTRHDPMGFQAIFWLTIAAFMTDWLDGPIARRTKDQDQTWLGYHDFEIDLMITFALGITLVTYQIIWPVLVSIGIFIVWFSWRAFIAKQKLEFWKTGIWPDHKVDTRDSMLIEAMMAVIDFSFLYLVWQQDLELFKLVLIWIFAVSILNPKRSLARVTGFIDVLKRILPRRAGTEGSGEEQVQGKS